MREHESPHPEAGQLSRDLVERRPAKTLPRILGEALRARIQPDCEPVPRDLDTRAQRLPVVGDAHREDDAGRARSECEPDVVRALHPARDLERHAHPGRHATHDVQVDRPALPGTVEVDEMDRASALRDEPFRDHLGPVGRRADPRRGTGPVDDPGAAAGKVDRGDDEHARPAQAPVSAAARTPPGAVSVREARTAASVVSMSAVVIPWWVTARMVPWA